MSQWEVGFGTYTTATGVLTRGTVLFNSLGTTAKISFTTAPQVAIVALAEDLFLFNAAMSLTTTQKKQAQQNVYVPPTRTILTASSGTYNLPNGCLCIDVEMVGGGGGGGGSGSAGSPTVGVSGGNTTFGTSFLVANGGAGASASNGTQASGGTASGGDINITGANGGPPSNVGSVTWGALGGDSRLGVQGLPGIGGNPGNPASGYGAGGGGAGASTTPANCGGGGAAGGYLRKLISSPSASYSYANGAAGTGGVAGTGGAAGGAGVPGVIIVTEYYGS